MEIKFSEHLKALRIENNLSRSALATRLNVSVRLISYWENGERECDFNTLIKIADIFSVSIDYLLGYKPANSNTTISEDELLRIFRQLSPEQKDICIEQCKVFIKVNQRRMKKSSSQVRLSGRL